VWKAAEVGAASSAVLRATVTRTPERHLLRLITSEMPFNMLVSKALCVYIGMAIGSANIFLVYGHIGLSVECPYRLFTNELD